MAEMKLTTVDLLRHGEPEGGEIFRGTTDVLLNELGWQQMQDSVASHEQYPWDSIFSSPLKRCAAFAENISSSADIELQLAEDLQEMYFGEWEGKLIKEVQEQDNQRLQSFWRDPEKHPAPGGESTKDAYQRANQFLEKTVCQHQGKHLLMISHGGIIRLLLIRALGLPLSSMAKISVPYACLSRLQIFQLDDSELWIQLVSHHSVLGHMQALQEAQIKHKAKQ